MNVSKKLAACLLAFVVVCDHTFDVVEGNDCAQRSQSCKACVGLGDNCFWCSDSEKCLGDYHPTSTKQKNCTGKAYWKQCYVSSKLLIIVLPVAGVVVLLVVGCLIYCCCCRNCCGKRKKKMFEKEDKKIRKERNERRQLNDHRKAERQARNEEIRMKYGLKPSGESRYQRMDNYP